MLGDGARVVQQYKSRSLWNLDNAIFGLLPDVPLLCAFLHRASGPDEEP